MAIKFSFWGLMKLNQSVFCSKNPVLSPPAVRVSLPQVARVLSEVYGDRMAAQSGGSGSEGESFPLQQKLLVCCLLLLIRNGKSKEVVLGKVRGFYAFIKT